jgi:hypothetical protein
MSRKILALLFGILAFNFLFFSAQNSDQSLVLFGIGSIWFFLLTLSAHLFLGVSFFKSFTSRRQTYAVTSSVLACLSAGAAVYRASSVDQIVLGLVAVVATFVTTYLYALTHEKFGAFTELLLLPLQLGLEWIGTAAELFAQLPTRIGKFFSQASGIVPKWKVKSSTTNSVVRGLFLTVPFLFIVGVLLASADPIFSQSISRLFSIHVPKFPEWIFFRAGYTLVFLAISAPVAWMAIKEKFHSPLQNKIFKNMKIEGLMLSGAIALLLAVFLIIQFRYLFTTVSETELHQFGVQTYSEYVRKGFSELLIVSVLVYIVAGIGMVIYRAIPSKEANQLRTTNIVLLSEAVVFIFSIMRRVWLYQISHGLSRVRVYGMVFLVLMILFTIILILRHFKQLKVKWYAVEYLVGAAVLFSVFFINTDKIIATQFKPTVNGLVDYGYISRLSADAADGWIEAYQWAKQVLYDPNVMKKKEFSEDEIRQIVYAQDVINHFYDQRSELQRKYDSVGVSLNNLGKDEVKRANLAELHQYKRLQPVIFGPELDALKLRSDLLNQLLAEQKQQVTLDRSYKTPLVK